MDCSHCEISVIVVNCLLRADLPYFFPSFFSFVCSYLDRYHTEAVTKLLQNYRSHPAIIEVPNKCFYNNELQVCANQGTREMLCNWEGLPDSGKVRSNSHTPS